MLWKQETEGLQNLPIGKKISLTIFLCIVGIGYLFGFVNILLTYSANDQESGLSVKDIQVAFYGARDKTALEKSIDGSMKTYFASDSEYNSVKTWLSDGFKESDYETIQPIMDTSCNSCHSSAAQVAGVVTETYEDLSTYLVQDTGKSYSRLVGISHNHMLSSVVVVFILISIMFATSYSSKLKGIVCALALLTILFDIGGWWLAKASPGMAVFVILGGASMGTGWGVLIILPLIEVWLKKPGQAKSA